MKDNHISSQKLSIIIVTYKRNNDLQALLGSILSQTVDKKDYEILIIDNSADAQAKPIIQQYTTLPIQYFHNPKNGVSIGRNIGIKHAFSDFCLFLDDDNELQNTDIIRHIIQQDVVKLKRENNIAGINYKNTLGDGKTGYYHISALITCGTLIRRKYLEKIGNFNEHMLCYFEDTDVSIRLLKYGYDLIENGYIYIVHKESQECKSIRNNIFYLSQHMKNYIMSIWLNIPLGVFILLSLKYFCHLLPLKAFQLKMNIFTVYKIGVQSYRYGISTGLKQKREPMTYQQRYHLCKRGLYSSQKKLCSE